MGIYGEKSMKERSFRIFASLLMVATLSFAASAQKVVTGGKAVLWEQSDIGRKDLFYGPGGKAMVPNVSKVTVIKEEKAGHTKKYRIKDADGHVWVAKLGREAQAETVSVRLMWALGYRTEINYLVPSLTLPGKGTFKNVRLEARPDNIERLEEWKWKDNPFLGTNEFQAMKIMMVFLNNWDIVDVQNKILLVDGRNGKERQYIVSDLGATFGKMGNNNLPFIFRLGQTKNKPKQYAKAKFIKDQKDDGTLKLGFMGKNRDLFKGITVGQARWLANLLSKLKDSQLQDAFRAANYSAADSAILMQAIKRRISELNNITAQERLAQR